MKNSGAWAGFLIVAFVVVGLVGAFSDVVAQVPLARALAREDTLDAALATAGAPDRPARLEALRVALDDSAAAVIDGHGDFPARVAAERHRVRAAFRAESADLLLRMRIVLGVFTAVAAAFGVGILSVARKAG